MNINELIDAVTHGMIDLSDASTERLIQLGNVIECEVVNRMAQHYGYTDTLHDDIGVVG